MRKAEKKNEVNIHEVSALEQENKKLAAELN